MTAVTNVAMTPSTYAASASATWTITLAPAASHPLRSGGDTLKIDFPAGFDISAVVDGDLACGTGFDGSTVPTVVSIVGQRLTLTFDTGGSNALAAGVTGTLTVAHITNASAGIYAAAGFDVFTNRDSTPVSPSSGVEIGPPTQTSATTNGTGTTITVSFNRTMANPSGKHAQFAFNDGSARTFSAAALNADPTKIDLTVNGAAIASGATLTMSYTAGSVAAANGLSLSTFSGLSVTNIVAPPASFVSATTNAAGTVVTATWSANMADPTGKHAQFGGSRSYSAVALNADHTKLDLTISGSPVIATDTVTLSYTPGTVADANGNAVASLTNVAVTNAVVAPTVLYADVLAGGATIRVKFSKAMADPAGKHAQFAFHDGSTRSFSAAAAHSSTEYDLTVSGGAVSSSATVTLDYTAGSIVDTGGSALVTFAGRPTGQAGQTRYWVGDGGHVNDTSHYALSSGGTAGVSLPTVTEPVVFDSHSFTLAGQQVVFDSDFACASLDCSAVTHTPDFNWNNNVTFGGSLTLATAMTMSGAINPPYAITSSGGGTLTMAGHTIPMTQIHQPDTGWNFASGVWYQADDFVQPLTETVFSGEWHTNNHALELRWLTVNTPGFVGTSTVTIHDYYIPYATLNSENAELVLNPDADFIGFGGIMTTWHKLHVVPINARRYIGSTITLSGMLITADEITLDGGDASGVAAAIYNLSGCVTGRLRINDLGQTAYFGDSVFAPFTQGLTATRRLYFKHVSLTGFTLSGVTPGYANQSTDGGGNTGVLFRKAPWIQSGARTRRTVRGR